MTFQKYTTFSTCSYFDKIITITQHVVVHLVIFCVHGSTGEALKCYVCNSGIDKTGCVQSATQTLSPQFLKDCSEIGGEGKYTVCRKIDQDVPNSSDGKIY